MDVEREKKTTHEYQKALPKDATLVVTHLLSGVQRQQQTNTHISMTVFLDMPWQVSQKCIQMSIK